MATLADLEGHLLGAAWPPERNVLGQRVCKSIRKLLLTYAGKVVLTSSTERYSSQAVSTSLCNFTQSSAQLEIRAVQSVYSSLPLLRGIVDAERFGFSGLTSLELSESRMFTQAREDYSFLSSLSSLQRLNISHNPTAFHAWDQALSNLTSLTDLDISFCNQVSRSFIRAVSGLQSLQFFRIAGVGASAWASSTYDPQICLFRAISACHRLVHLTITNNATVEGQRTLQGNASLSCCLLQLSCLTHLNISNNAIGGCGEPAIADAINKLSKLQHLDIGGIRLNKTSVSFIDTAFSHPPFFLVSLSISWNNIGESGATCLASCLRHPRFSALQHLHIAGNAIQRSGCLALQDVFEQQHSPRLLSLDLAANSLRDHAIAPLLRAVARGNGLKQLVLSFSDLVPGQGGEVFAAISHCTRLSHLSLAGNTLVPPSSSLLLPALHRLQCITPHRLQQALVQSEARSQQARHSLRMLTHCHAISHLDLAACHLGPAGAEWLGAVLRGLAGVRCVRVGGNRLYSQGLAAFLAAAGELPLLRELDVACNRLGCNGVGEMVRAVRGGGLPVLARLNLGWNKLGDDGAKAVTALLAKVTNLQDLNLNMNDIHSAGARALAAGLPVSSVLRSLRLAGNPFTRRDSNDGSRDLLAAARERCPRLFKLDCGQMTLMTLPVPTQAGMTRRPSAGHGIT